MNRIKIIIAFVDSHRLAQILLCVLIVCVLSTRFYNKVDLGSSGTESHIPATILAKMYGYDLEGYGLSFVSAEGIGNTYGAGAFRILQTQYLDSKDTQTEIRQRIIPQGFEHYTSAIGIQGFFVCLDI